MPPLKNVAPGIDGDLLKALFEAGHESQLVIVDSSYTIPRGSHIEKFQGDSSPKALAGILGSIAFEGSQPAYLMSPDPDTTKPSTYPGEEFEAILGEEGLGFKYVGRKPDRHNTDKEWQKGFYALANDSDRQTLFVKTFDLRKYACVLFVVGHGQTG